MVNENGCARSMKLPNGEPRPVPNKICAYLRRNFMIFDILIGVVCEYRCGPMVLSHTKIGSLGKPGEDA